MTNLILEAREEQVRILTLNDPDRRNPISDLPMVDALCAALKKADQDPGVRAVIITGAGSAFSSGGDIKKMQPGAGLRDELPALTRANYRDGIQRIPLLFQTLEVPVIAAVNGPAIGAGCDLACMCDIRIASETAKFAQSFVKVGLVPGDGGAWLLPRIVGFSKASEMALIGDILNAEEALACGLVSRVVAPAQLLDEARQVAQRIAANPAHAVRMTKSLLREGQMASLASVLETSAAMQALAHATADHDEAVSAFIGRRTPNFKGP